VRNLASFETSLNFEPPAFENASKYPNFGTKMQCWDDRPMHVHRVTPDQCEKMLSYRRETAARCVSFGQKGKTMMIILGSLQSA